jgi:hypothetical protein
MSTPDNSDRRNSRDIPEERLPVDLGAWDEGLEAIKGYRKKQWFNAAVAIGAGALGLTAIGGAIAFLPSIAAHTGGPIVHYASVVMHFVMSPTGWVLMGFFIAVPYLVHVLREHLRNHSAAKFEQGDDGSLTLPKDADTPRRLMSVQRMRSIDQQQSNGLMNYAL